MILEIFRDSFEYVFKDSSILKLGILSILSFSVMPIIILSGYFYRTVLIGIDSMINQNNKKPSFNNIGEMLVQGLKIIFIVLIYNLATMIISYFIINQGHVFKVVEVIGESRIDFNLEIIALLAIIWFVSLLFTSVAIPNMVDNNGSLKAGFNIKEILLAIKSVGILNYIKFSLLGLVTFIGISILVFLIIQILISILSNYGLILTGQIVIAIYTFLAFFLIFPFFLLLESRAIALMYNLK